MITPLEVERILMPVELDACSRRALAYAVRLAETLDARLDVVHAVPPLAAAVTSLGMPDKTSRAGHS